MPLRSCFPSFAIARLPRLFHSTAFLRDDVARENHYETLQIQPNATPVEVKKSFYALSKAHHPDRNPSDPDASKRFVKISEAYATLSTPAKRQEYDRSLSLHSSFHHHSHHHRPQGSYHSSGPAGGRPASGLSKRRTQFRGPPPSFYRSGGWGEHSSKRRPESEKAEAAGMGGGMGHGQSANAFGEENDMPHWDREGHLKTQRRVSHERIYRKRKGEEEVGTSEREKGLLPSFLLVGGILGLGILVPSLVFEGVSGKKGRKEER